MAMAIRMIMKPVMMATLNLRMVAIQTAKKSSLMVSTVLPDLILEPKQI